LTTLGESHATQLMPSLEYVVPVQSSHPDLLVIGPLPAEHCVHVLCAASTTRGASQLSHFPIVLKVAPVHGIHAVRSAFGPCPAVHGRHDERSSLTTLGESHAIHSMPCIEYVVPVQSSHPDLLVIGPLPAEHCVHVVCAASTTRGASQLSHTPCTAATAQYHAGTSHALCSSFVQTHTGTMIGAYLLRWKLSCQCTPHIDFVLNLAPLQPYTLSKTSACH
jgi:hypothetical protein